MTQNSIEGPIKRIVTLSNMGDPESQEKIKHLFLLCSAVSEEKALKIWAEKFLNLQSEETKITLFSEGGHIDSDSDIMIQKLEEGFRLILREAESGVRIEPPDPSKLVSPPTTRLKKIDLRSISLCEGLAGLEGLSKIHCRVSDPLIEITTLGLGFIAGHLHKILEESIRSRGLWTVPPRGAIDNTRFLKKIDDTFGKWADVQVYKEEKSGVICEQKLISAWGQGLIEVIHNKMGLKEDLYQYLEEPARTLRGKVFLKFKANHSTGPEREVKIEGINPILGRFIRYQVGTDPDGAQLLMISGPSTEVIKEIIRPLHESFYLETI